jgi:spore coat protein U-like protein
MHVHWTALIRFTVALAICLGTAGRADAANCSISVTPVVFGNYNVFNASPLDSTGSVVYRCNGGAKVIWITMSRGGNSDGYIPRAMSKGGDKLEYNLYRDATRSVVWGNLTGGTSIYYDVDPANNQNVTVTIYGRVPAGQDVSAGGYSDTVQIEINF